MKWRARRRRRARRALRAVALYAIEQAPKIHYAQVRPMSEMNARPPALNRVMDCSEFVTWAYKVAGLPDPNGAAYNGTGYTGTLATHGRRVTRGRVRIGDLAHYGNPFTSSGHVAVCYRGAPWALRRFARFASHGSEGGPYDVSLFYRRDLGEIRRYIL